MRSDLVVFTDPVPKDDPGLEDRVELFTVQLLISHGAVEALHEGILLRAPLLDECRDHPAVSEPGDHGLGDELTAVVGAEDPGPAMDPEQLFEAGDHVAGADRGADPTAE